MIHLGVKLTLHPFTLEVAATLGGKVTAIMGPSGSGKTSLLEIIAGLRCDAVGESSSATSRSSTRVRAFGWRPRSAVLATCRKSRRSFPISKCKTTFAMAYVRAQNRACSSTKRCRCWRSGTSSVAFLERYRVGEAQRVAIARALLTKPRLLFSTSHLRRSTRSSRSASCPTWSAFATRAAFPCST